MSVELFLEKLVQLGYPNADKMTSDSCAWLFGSKLAPFMNLICDHIQVENILQVEEVKKFNAMVSAGEEILSHQEVGEIQNIFNTSVLSSSQSEKDVARLKKKLDDKKRHLARIHILQTQLSLNCTTLSNRTALLETLNREAVGNRRNLDDKCFGVSLSMDDIMSKTHKSLLEVDEILGTKDQVNSIYLTYLPLDDVLKANHRHNQELKDCLVQKFIQNSTVLGVTCWESRLHNWTVRDDIQLWTDSTLCWEVGDYEDVNEECDDSLKNHGALLRLHRMESIRHREKEVSVARALHLADEISKAMQCDQFPISESEIRMKLSSVNDALIATEIALDKAREDVGDQVTRNVQITLYARKIERLDEILIKKKEIAGTLDRVISHLLNRCAVHQFLFENLLLDLQRFRNPSVENIRDELLLLAKGFESRSKSMRILKEIADRSQKENSIDQVLGGRLVDVFHPGRKDDIILKEVTTLRNVFKEVNSLRMMANQIQYSQAACLTTLTSLLTEMVDCVTGLQRIIWRDCPATGNGILLSPKDLIEAKINLRQIRNTLTERLRISDSSFRKKLKIIKSDSEQLRIRQAYLVAPTNSCQP